MEINLLNKNMTAEVIDHRFSTDNFKTLTIPYEAEVKLNISDSNYEYIGQTMFPDGLIPDTFDKKLKLLNKLIEEIGPIFDDENPEYFISAIEYKHDEDRLYCKFKEEKR